MKFTGYTGVLLITLGVLGFGCSDMGTEPPLTGGQAPPGSIVSFSQDILPIFSRFGCAGCHGGNGGLFVGTVQQLLRGGNNGPAVVPGRADSSLIIRKMSSPPPFGDRMPQGGPYLPDSTIQVIRTWIDQGAQNN